MNISGSVIPGGTRLVQLVGRSLSRPARQRLEWLRFYEAHGRNARLTCRHFGISPDVFYRWRRRYDPRRPVSLEDDLRTRRPRRVRQPHTPVAVIERIRFLREQYPRWGKDKLAVLLRREGIALSASTVGRVLSRLRARGLVREPRRRGRRRVWRPRPYAQRLPAGYAVRQPGDLVQVDTLDIEVLANVRRKQFTARDMVSRYDVVEAYGRATAHTAAAFLELLVRRMPFAVRVLQVDGGSEFRGAFEAACQRREIRLFILPPQSPKLNGHVERAHRTHREEFYEVMDLIWTVPELNRELRAWEAIYNTVRPHQALGYQTPEEFLRPWQTHHREGELSPI